MYSQEDKAREGLIAVVVINHLESKHFSARELSAIRPHTLQRDGRLAAYCLADRLVACGSERLRNARGELLTVTEKGKRNALGIRNDRLTRTYATDRLAFSS